jgi:hypothetical protein
MIACAKDRPLISSSTSLPSMRGTMRGWTRPLVISLIRKQLVNYEVSEANAVTIQTTGVLQPLAPEKLKLKPEGERSWVWKTLHCAFADMQTDDVAILFGVRYRVMEKTSFADYGFAKYEMVEDFQNATNGATATRL